MAYSLSTTILTRWAREFERSGVLGSDEQGYFLTPRGMTLMNRAVHGGEARVDIHRFPDHVTTWYFGRGKRWFTPDGEPDTAGIDKARDKPGFLPPPAHDPPFPPSSVATDALRRRESLKKGRPVEDLEVLQVVDQVPSLYVVYAKWQVKVVNGHAVASIEGAHELKDLYGEITADLFRSLDIGTLPPALADAIAHASIGGRPRAVTQLDSDGARVFPASALGAAIDDLVVNLPVVFDAAGFNARYKDLAGRNFVMDFPRAHMIHVAPGLQPGIDFDSTTIGNKTVRVLRASVPATPPVADPILFSQVSCIVPVAIDGIKIPSGGAAPTLHGFASVAPGREPGTRSARSATSRGFSTAVAASIERHLLAGDSERARVLSADLRGFVNRLSGEFPSAYQASIHGIVVGCQRVGTTSSHREAFRTVNIDAWIHTLIHVTRWSVSKLGATPEFREAMHALFEEGGVNSVIKYVDDCPQVVIDEIIAELSDPSAWEGKPATRFVAVIGVLARIAPFIIDGRATLPIVDRRATEWIARDGEEGAVATVENESGPSMAEIKRSFNIAGTAFPWLAAVKVPWLVTLAIGTVGGARESPSPEMAVLSADIHSLVLDGMQLPCIIEQPGINGSIANHLATVRLVAENAKMVEPGIEDRAVAEVDAIVTSCPRQAATRVQGEADVEGFASTSAKATWRAKLRGTTTDVPAWVSLAFPRARAAIAPGLLGIVLFLVAALARTGSGGGSTETVALAQAYAAPVAAPWLLCVAVLSILAFDAGNRAQARRGMLLDNLFARTGTSKEKLATFTGLAQASASACIALVLAIGTSLTVDYIALGVAAGVSFAMLAARAWALVPKVNARQKGDPIKTRHAVFAVCILVVFGILATWIGSQLWFPPFSSHHIKNPFSASGAVAGVPLVVMVCTVLACYLVLRGRQEDGPRGKRAFSRFRGHVRLLARRSAAQGKRGFVVALVISMALTSSAFLVPALEAGASTGCIMLNGGDVALGNPLLHHSTSAMTYSPVTLGNIVSLVPDVTAACRYRFARDWCLDDPAVTTVGASIDSFGFGSTGGESFTVAIVDPPSYIAVAGDGAFRIDEPGGVDARTLLMSIDATPSIVLQSELKARLAKRVGDDVVLRLDGMWGSFTIAGYADVLPGVPWTTGAPAPWWPSWTNYCGLISWKSYDSLVEKALPDIAVRSAYWNGSDIFVDDGAHALWGAIGMPVNASEVETVLAPWIANGTVASAYPFSSLAGLATIAVKASHALAYSRGGLTAGDMVGLDGSVTGVDIASDGGWFPQIVSVDSAVPTSDRGSVASILAWADAALNETPCIAPAVVVAHETPPFGQERLVSAYEVAVGDRFSVVANGTTRVQLRVVATAAPTESFSYPSVAIPLVADPCTSWFHPYRLATASTSGLAGAMSVLQPSAGDLLISGEKMGELYHDVLVALNASDTWPIAGGGDACLTSWRTELLRFLGREDQLATGYHLRAGEGHDPAAVSASIQAAWDSAPATSNWTACPVAARWRAMTRCDLGAAWLATRAGATNVLDSLQDAHAATGVHHDPTQVTLATEAGSALVASASETRSVCVTAGAVTTIMAVTIAVLPTRRRLAELRFVVAGARRWRAPRRMVAGMGTAALLPFVGSCLAGILVGTILAALAAAALPALPFLVAFPFVGGYSVGEAFLPSIWLAGAVCTTTAALPVAGALLARQSEIGACRGALVARDRSRDEHTKTPITSNVSLKRSEDTSKRT